MNNAGYKVSIITVVYNGAKTIEQTIKSVLCQTYKNIEYIVIDGASTDGSQQIIEKYANDISYYVSESDNGLYYAMNKGIEKATGDIIGIINSDDWYIVDAVEKVVNYFGENNIGVAYGRVLNIVEKGENKLNLPSPLNTMWYKMAVPHPSVFVKKDIYKRYGMFDVQYKLASDYELLLRMYVNHVSFGYVNAIIACFREGGMSALRHKEVIEEGYKISMSYIQLCKDNACNISQIEEHYKWHLFPFALQENKGMLNDLIDEYFDASIIEIGIFGTGVWGEICYKVLAETGSLITYFTDNNEAKWNTELHDIKIINPNELGNLQGYVLIAVMDNGEEIKRQITDMGNSRLKCVCIKELEELFIWK